MKDSELIFGLIAAFNKNEYSFVELKYLVEPFGITETTLRTNIFRMIKKGILLSGKRGKGMSYRLTDRGSSILSNVARSFKTADYKTWDNSFWGLVFSVPEFKGELRHKIRKKLLKYRFACMHPGFWIRPVNEEERIPVVLDSIIKLKYCRLIKFYNQSDITREEANAYWKTNEVNEELKRGVILLESETKELDKLGPRQALVKKMRTGNEIVSILFKDPLLPEQFLPNNWYADILREKFAEYDQRVTQASKQYWNQIFIEE